METLKENIIKKYQRATKKYIKNELLKKGYIKTPENEILKLNPFKKEFELIDIPSIINIINIYVPNFWSIAPEKQINIILNNFLELSPMATETEINNYVRYMELTSELINENELKKDKDKLINDNKQSHKKVFQGGYLSPEYQSQALINNNVFYSNGNYYQFDNKTDLFIKLTNKDIFKILEKEFKEIGKYNQVDLLDINGYMKEFYKNNIKNSHVPVRYNKNKSNKKELENLKNDYEKINKIIRGFE